MVKNIIDSFKEISYDLLGFFIPGFIGIFTASLFLNSQFVNSIFIPKFLISVEVLIIIVVSYIMGYFAMGISEYKKEISGKFSYKEVIQNKIEQLDLFTDALSKYKEVSRIENDINLRPLRTRVMSYIPESDGKVYNFRFRSDLCENTICILVFNILGVSFLLGIEFVTGYLILKDFHSVAFMIIFMIIFVVFLGFTRNRYYNLTMRIPLSIFLSKKINNS